MRLAPVAFFLAGACLVAACGGDAEDEDGGGSVASVTAESSTPAPALTATATAGLDQLLGETRIEWENCDVYDTQAGPLASCGYRTHPFFENWNVLINYDTDDQGRRLGVRGTIHGYGPSCEWDLPNGVTYDARLIDDVATYSGELIGTGRCEGLIWSYTQTWDDRNHTMVTAGPIERAD